MVALFLFLSFSFRLVVDGWGDWLTGWKFFVRETPEGVILVGVVINWGAGGDCEILRIIRYGGVSLGT